MPCDTRRRPQQTITERKLEINQVIAKVAAGLAKGTIKPVIGPQGAIAFTGLSETDRAGVTDACAYRRLLSGGSQMAILAIQRAEQLAGRKVDNKQIAVGAHAHGDGKGGLIWHSHKG